MSHEKTAATSPPPSPYPEAGQETEPAWDLDEQGRAVERAAR